MQAAIVAVLSHARALILLLPPGCSHGSSDLGRPRVPPKSERLVDFITGEPFCYYRSSVRRAYPDPGHPFNLHTLASSLNAHLRAYLCPRCIPSSHKPSRLLHNEPTVSAIIYTPPSDITRARTRCYQL